MTIMIGYNDWIHEDASEAQVEVQGPCNITRKAQVACSNRASGFQK